MRAHAARALVLSLLMALGGTLAAQQPGRPGAALTLEQVQGEISTTCDAIMAAQQPDGSFQLCQWGEYPVGNTALAVLALEHGAPHLEGEQATRANDAVSKGLAFILATPPEQRTYSGGLVIAALYDNHPTKYQNVIDTYASMIVRSQKTTGYETGMWNYGLYPASVNKADHSNSQVALLGLLYATYGGFQVPPATWDMLRQHYAATQKPDGGWNYGWQAGKQPSRDNMTAACTISLLICEEMLAKRGRHVCETREDSPTADRGLKWMDKNLNLGGMDVYGLYAVERLGILSGMSTIGGKDWWMVGAQSLMGGRQRNMPLTQGRLAGDCFAVLFLSRGLEPIAVNKVKYEGGWRNDPYDAKNWMEHVSRRYQYPRQWRIVTLDADVEMLLKVPILYFNGHKFPTFSTEEKQKVKDYVKGGGSLFAMACCDKKEFDQGFRAFAAELWPETPLEEIPAEDRIYRTPRTLKPKPTFYGVRREGTVEEGAPVKYGVIYSPKDFCCRWDQGAGSAADLAMDAASNLYFYMDPNAGKPAITWAP